jgi:hypothetical protein
VPVLPHASDTVHVFVDEYVQPDTRTSALTVPVATKPVLQLSVTVAAPNAASICACVGLHASVKELPKEIVGF